jgi:hypothetical protein
VFIIFDTTANIVDFALPTTGNTDNTFIYTENQMKSMKKLTGHAMEH